MAASSTRKVEKNSGRLLSRRLTPPGTEGPAAIAAGMADAYNNAPKGSDVPETVRVDLMGLETVLGEWWDEGCGLPASNPFADVLSPKRGEVALSDAVMDRVQGDE